MMAETVKDRLARQIADLRIAFDLAHSDERKYPVAGSMLSWTTRRRYIKIAAGDPMVHENVVRL